MNRKVEDVIKHYGVKGMKWDVEKKKQKEAEEKARRAQNPQAAALADKIVANAKAKKAASRVLPTLAETKAVAASLKKDISKTGEEIFPKKDRKAISKTISKTKKEVGEAIYPKAQRKAVKKQINSIKKDFKKATNTFVSKGTQKDIKRAKKDVDKSIASVKKAILPKKKSKLEKTTESVKKDIKRFMSKYSR